MPATPEPASRRRRPTPRPSHRIGRRVALAAIVAGLVITTGCTMPPAPSPSRSASPSADASAIAASPSQTVTIRLLAFNDFHGHLEPGDNTLALPDPARPGAPPLRVPAGGAAHLAGLLNELRRGHPHTLTLHTGDLVGASPLASALFRDEPTIEVANAMGVGLAVVGNHEFDRGLRELLRLVHGGCAPSANDSPATSCADPGRPHGGTRFADGPGRGWLAANVVDASGRPVLPATAVRTFDGVRVGFVGVVTRSTPTIVPAAGIAGLRFLDEVETINRHAADLRAQGVEAIVALVHEGGVTRGDWNDPACPGAQGPLFEMLPRLSHAIDVVFSAHTHQGYACRLPDAAGRPRVVIQSTSYGRAVGVVDLVVERAGGDVDRDRTVAANRPVLREAPPAGWPALWRPAVPDPAVQALVDRAVALAAPSADRRVGRIAAGFDRRADAVGGGDHALGRLIADAQLAATRSPAHGGAQVAFMNPGGIRADLRCDAGPCDVTVGQAFAVQPFGNTLVTMTLTGAQLRMLLEQQATGVNAARPRLLQPSAGLGYTWVAAAAAGQRVRDLVLDGRPVAPEDRVRVTVNGFLADGGDGFDVLPRGTERTGGPPDLDALLDHLRRAPAPLAPDPTPRIRAGR